MSPSTQWLAWFWSVALYAVLGAALAQGRAKPIAAVWATLGLGLVWLCPPSPPLLRSLCALLYVWSGWVRVIQLTLSSRRYDLAQRVWHVLAIFDPRTVTFGARQLDPRRIARCLFMVLLATATGLYATSVDSAAEAWFARIARDGVGAIFVYSTVDAAFSILEVVHRAFGVRPPPLHRHPILSASVVEFWGQRWNRVVGGWLRSTFYMPLARRGKPALGLLATFAASSALHAYFVWAALGAVWALMMASFFLVQWMIVQAELSLRVYRWPPWLARLWTVLMLLATSPLFVEPFLRLFRSP